jgi:hypothetical protein
VRKTVKQAALEMTVSADIAEARMLLERAEREGDPEQETRLIEEALLLLEMADDPGPDETRLIGNLRLSYARRLLTQMPKLKSVSFEIWLFYFNVLVQLASEVEALTRADPVLASNRQAFLGMWGSEVLAAAERGEAS